MHLYNVTLQPASAISTAVLGHFRGSKTQELAVARHERLELWDASPTTGRLTVLSTQPLFAAIRSLAAFRVAGSGSTHLALTCDNGAVSILAYDHSAGGRFRVVQHHEFARSGLRRSAGGEYVAADPRGRALMVAGVERSRLVYVVARDAQGEVQVASPLDGSRSGSAGGAVCLCVVGVDVGYENPAFAALEAGAAGCEVAWYEVDLGLNHVVRRWSCAVSASAGRLVALPGDDGPSGVLVCSAGLVEWVAPTMAGARVRAHIPRRADDPRPVQLVAHAVHRMRQAFFILAQGTLGDLYKVTVAYSGAQVTGLHVAYFDTLPGCASALCILRAGFLFAACGGDGGGAHRLLQFADLGDESGGAAEGETFVPHDGLRSLAPVDELDCPAPVVRARMLNLAQELAPQMYALGGRTGAHPALRIVRRAADALELAASELPARALHVFRAHPWVAVSFARHTLVLRAASDGALQEASEHPLATDHQTLALCALPGAALLQATSAGLVLAPSAPGARRFEWAAAGGVSAAALAGATALVVDGGCARVLDVRPGEISERPDAIDAAECVALSPVDPGQRAPRFAAVGCSDGSVRVYLLGAPGSPISLAALQALSEAPASVAMARIAGQMLLFVGLPSGVLVRARVDEVSGELSSVRSRFLGPHAVLVRALDGVLVALAPQPWVCHAVRGCVTMTPLAYDALDDVAPLEVDGVERALVAVAQGSLRVLALDRLDSPEGSVAAIPLSLTPRIMHAHASGHFAVVEAEHRAQWAHNTAGDGDVEAEYAVSRTCEEASWAALVRVVNAFDGSTTHVEKLRDSWTVVSMTTVTFASTVPDQNQNQDDSDAPPLYLALGCARNMRLRPRSCEAAEIRLFRWSADGRRLLHVHTTPLDDIPQALVCLAGHLVVAQGPALRV
ncbi:pre-mRNA-splicing factor rse1, partial [Coemansia sp. RSA 2603]